MDIAIDTSAIIAIIVGEVSRERLIEATKGATLIAPSSVPFEVGNAFSAMFKQRKITLDQARQGLASFESMMIRFCKPDFVRAIAIAHQSALYAYDAYVLECALRHGLPLLTLDKKMSTAGAALRLAIMEF